MVVLPRTFLAVAFLLACAADHGTVHGPTTLDSADTSDSADPVTSAPIGSIGSPESPVWAAEVCGHAVAAAPDMPGLRLDGNVGLEDIWWHTYGTVPLGNLGFNGAAGDLNGDGHADLLIEHIQNDMGLSVFFGPLTLGNWPEAEAAAFAVIPTPEVSGYNYGLADVDLDGTFELLFYSDAAGVHNWDIFHLAPGPIGRVETSALPLQATLDLTSWDTGALPALRWSPPTDADLDGDPDLWLTTYDGAITQSFLKLLPGPMLGTRDPLLESIASYELVASLKDQTYLPSGYPDQDVLAAGDVDGSGVSDVAFAIGGTEPGDGGVAWILDPPLVTAPLADVLTSQVLGNPDRLLAFSTGVVDVPDMNGDGYDESAFSAEVYGSIGVDGGIVLLQYGPPPAGTFPEECLSVTVTTTEDRAGADEIFTGDLDGDGVPDLVAHGLETWVFYGPVPTGVIGVSDADAFLPGAMPLGVADFDGDGYDDVALGNAWGGNHEGEAYILLGGWL